MNMLSVKDYLRALEAHGKKQYDEYEPFRVKAPTGKAGPWTVRHFTTEYNLAYLRLARDGRAPGLGQFTSLSHVDRGVVMTDTIPEVNDFLRHAKHLVGDVLITGLGIGLAVHILTTYKPCSEHVKSITVVEIDNDVYKLTGRFYARFPRVTIHVADAWTWQPPKVKMYDAIWHDIWDEGGKGDEWRRIKARYRKFVHDNNQHCWGKGV